RRGRCAGRRDRRRVPSLRSPVVYALGLTDRALHATLRADLHVDRDADPRLDLASEHSPALFSVLFARAGPAFADDPELVERPGGGDLEEKVPGEAGVLEDHLLDLRRKEIHAADDHHVVATRVDAGDAPEGSRRAGQQSGEIARAVADD